MITQIELKNWKSHEETSLTLSEGTNVLVGIMGSGKSAVLDAITYGLFGTVPAVRNRKIKLDDLIKKRPSKKDSAEVEVEFVSPREEKYVVRRVLERGEGTTLAELRKEDGTLVEKPRSTNVTDHVTSILQIDYDFFERMIYAEQNQLDRFLTLEPRKRRKRVDELLKINKFENARKNTTTLINRLRDRREDRRQDLDELREDEEIEALPSLEDELKETKSEKEDLKRNEKEIEPQIQRVEKRISEFEKTKEKIDDLSKKIESIRGRIEALDQQITRAEERLGEDMDLSTEDLEKRESSLEGELQGAKNKVEELESEADSKIGKISELKTEMKSFKKRIDELKEEIKGKEKSKEKLEEINLSKLQEELEELDERQESSKNRLSGLKVHLEDLQNSIDDLQEAESTCPTCDRPLTEEMKKDLIQNRRRDLEETKTQASDLEDEIREIEENISERKKLQSRAEHLKKDVENLTDLKSKLSNLQEKFEKKSKDLERVQEKKGEIQEALEKVKEKVAQIRGDYEDVKKKKELLSDLSSSRKEKEKNRKKKERLQEKLQKEEEEFDETLVEELKEKHQSLIKKKEHFKTRLTEIGKLIEQKEKLIENIRKKKQSLERREAEVEVLRDSIDSLNKIQRALSQSQTSLRKQVIEAVNGMMNNIWKDVYPYEDFRRVRLSIEEGRRTSDYELQLMDSSGTWNPVEGMTSGGERTCASLTLRIAFAVVLAPSLSWLVLDEPTHNLDSEGIDSLSEILRERVPKVVKQLLLITHEKRLESAVSGYLYRFSRDKNRDGPTEVQQVYEE